MIIQYIVAIIFVGFGTSVLATIANVNNGLEVPNGRSEFLTKNHLSFHAIGGEICKVEVVQNEPIYQRVGKITPPVRLYKIFLT